MTPSGTLWLHVGTHKTGTTSIQRALRLKEAALVAQGIALSPYENAWQVATLFLRGTLVTTPRLTGMCTLPRLPDYDAIATRLRSSRGSCADMILSSEEFCMLRDGLEAFALRSFFRPMFARIVPILATRDPAHWQASRADQLRKSGTWEQQKALPDAHSNDGPWYYDLAAIRRFWEAIGPVTLIDYDAACATEGDILPAFARAIGQPGLFDELTPLRLNERSTRSQ